MLSSAWQGLSSIFTGLFGGGAGGGAGGGVGFLGGIGDWFSGLFGGGEAAAVVPELVGGFGGVGDAIGGVSSMFAARGGAVSGGGTGTSDSIPAMLSNGEYVVNAAATAKHGGILSAINGGAKFRNFAEGGAVEQNPGMSVNVGSAASAIAEGAGSSLGEGVEQAGGIAGTGSGKGTAGGDIESGSDGGEIEGGTPTDPLEYLRLMIRLQRKATEVSAEEANNRMAVLGGESMEGGEIVMAAEEAKAASVEEGEGAQAASRKKGNAMQKATSLIGAVVATSLAVIKSLATLGVPAGLPAAALAGAMGAVQIAMIAAAATGGRITHDGVDVTGGGKLSGAGSGTSDSIPAMLSDGEFVINAAQTQKYSAALAAINNGLPQNEILKRMPKGGGDIMGYATGGIVGRIPSYIGADERSGPGVESPTYNTTNINISGNVDQRAIDQIRGVISSSPKEVNIAGQRGDKNTKGIRRPRGGR
jgi:hypothetical protein